MSIASSRRRRGDDKANNLGIDVCDICYMCFHSGTSLSLHKRIHWRDCIFDCSTCNRRFSSLINLREHQKAHIESTSPLSTPTKNFETDALLLSTPTKKNVETEKAIKPTLIPIKSTSNPRKVKKKAHEKDEYPSEISPNILPAKPKLMLHHKRHYYVSKDKAVTKMAGTMMSCLLCSASFHGDRALTKHIREDHKGQDMSIIDTILPTGTIRCENCDMVFDSGKELLRHAKTCYDEPRDDDDDDDDSEDDAEVVDSRGVWQAKPFQCPKCDQILNNRYSLGGHMSSMHNPNRKRKNSRRKKINPVKSPKIVYASKEAPEMIDIGEESTEEVVVAEENMEEDVVGEESTEEVLVSEESPEEVVVPEESPEEVLVPEETPKKVEVAKETPKKVEVAKETPKKVEVAKETPKKVEVAKETPKKVEVAKETQKKVEVAKETPKKDEVSKETSNVVSCPDCKKFSKDGHRCQTHEENVKSHFKCKWCRKSFSKQNECALHMKNKCQVKSTQKGEMTLKCDNCHKGFNKMKLYELHKKEKLCQFDKTRDVTRSVVILEKLDEKSLKTTGKLKATVASKEKSNTTLVNKPFECRDCEKKCKSKMSLGVHMKQHSKRQELKAAPVSEAAKPAICTKFDIDKEAIVSKKTLAIVEDVGTPVQMEVKEKDNKLVEDSPVEFHESNKIATENLELAGLGGIEVKMKDVDKPIHEALPVETPKNVEENVSTQHPVSVAPGPDYKETLQKQPTLLCENSAASSISVLNGFSLSEVKDTPENDSNTAILEEQSNAPPQLIKDISENDEVGDSDENKSSILNGDATEDMKNVPQMITDPTDSENSELRGIIDFINNDCTE